MAKFSVPLQSDSWLKTDFALQGKHGFHLLEIGHRQDLGIDTYNQMVDVLNFFKYESMRLLKKYPLMVSKLAIWMRFKLIKRFIKKKSRVRLQG